MVLEDGCLCHWVRLSPPESIILGSFRLNMVATCDTFGDNASRDTSHILSIQCMCVYDAVTVDGTLEIRISYFLKNFVTRHKPMIGVLTPPGTAGRDENFYMRMIARIPYAYLLNQDVCS